MMRTSRSNTHGSTLVVTLTVVAALLVLLGVAVDYSGQISRNAQRSRKAAVALEIADGHLEYLFSSWRNINRSSTTTSFATSGGTDYSLAGTNYFFTSLFNPGPAPTPLPNMNPAATPPVIPTPAPSNFPTETSYSLTQYRIQAADPMITLDAAGNSLVEGDSGKKGTGGYVAMPRNVVPPASYGPNDVPAFNLQGGFPYSFYYLASVDVTVPSLVGNVTAKVRRVFEKKYDLPWSFAIFYADDLEFHPSSPFTVTGPIHTNGSLYISTSNFNVASPSYAAPTPFPTSGPVSYAREYVNGFMTSDPRYPGTPTAPNFAKSVNDASVPLSDCPPSQVSPYLPFGWNLKLTTSDLNANNDGYHEIIQPPDGYPIPPSSAVDPLQPIRYYNQAGIKVLIDQNNNVRVFRPSTTSGESMDPTKLVECRSNSSGNDLNIWRAIAGPNGALATNLAMFDAREGVNVRMADLDIAKLTTVINLGSGTSGSGSSTIYGITGFNGIIYIADTTPPYTTATNTSRNVVSSPAARLGSTNVSTAERAIRLINGASLPNGNSSAGNRAGLTVVSLNPVYIRGNYNTGGANPPSNTDPATSPVVSGYTRKPAAVIADAINVLSSNWSDTNSTSTITNGGYNVTNPRSAVSTTINTAMVAGNVPTSTGTYSGGGEGFIRLQEDWRTQSFVYYGSMVQLYKSMQGNSPGSAGGSFHKNPAATRWFYDYALFSEGSPPGNLIIAAYLQQQRWYQVY